METDDVFVIAVRRERRGDVPADWIQTVRGTSGVTVVGDASPVRVQVRATPDAIEQIQHELSEYLQIEKLSPHRLS